MFFIKSLLDWSGLHSWISYFFGKLVYIGVEWWFIVLSSLRIRPIPFYKRIFLRQWNRLIKSICCIQKFLFIQRHPKLLHLNKQRTQNLQNTWIKSLNIDSECRYQPITIRIQFFKYFFKTFNLVLFDYFVCHSFWVRFGCI